MTNERAKSELMQLYGSLSEEKKQALDVLMAQADVLDKLRAEITEKKMKTHDAMMRVFAQECIDIIDHYRNEVRENEKSHI